MTIIKDICEHVNDGWGSPQDQYESLVRPVLEYVRDNISLEMVEAGLDIYGEDSPSYDEDRILDIFGAMLDVILQDSSSADVSFDIVVNDVGEFSERVEFVSQGLSDEKSSVVVGSVNTPRREFIFKGLGETYEQAKQKYDFSKDNVQPQDSFDGNYVKVRGSYDGKTIDDCKVEWPWPLKFTGEPHIPPNFAELAKNYHRLKGGRVPKRDQLMEVDLEKLYYMLKVLDDA